MKTEAERLLKEKQVKITANRLLILDYLIKTKQPVRLTDLEEALPWADKATIFRSLKTFENKAVIHTIKDEDRAVKYALCSNQCEVGHHIIHPHFHCEVCGKTICLTEIDIPKVSLPNNFEIRNYKLVINGVCNQCQNKL